jgi:hypothetical protein
MMFQINTRWLSEVREPSGDAPENEFYIAKFKKINKMEPNNLQIMAFADVEKQ